MVADVFGAVQNVLAEAAFLAQTTSTSINPSIAFNNYGNRRFGNLFRKDKRA